MQNDYALQHARRLHAHGIDLPTIEQFLRRMSTRQERREILARLPQPELVAA